MSDIEKYTDTLILIEELISKFNNDLGNIYNGSLKYMVSEIVSSHKSMFDRFCPHAIGDRVELSKTLNLNNAPGWQHCKHFLIKGSKATVKTRGYHKERFTFGVIFDDESWIDCDGKIREVKDKHHFNLSEDDIT